MTAGPKARDTLSFYDNEQPWDSGPDSLLGRCSDWVNEHLPAWQLTGRTETPMKVVFEALRSEAEGVNGYREGAQPTCLPPRRKQVLEATGNFFAPGWLVDFTPTPLRATAQARALMAFGACTRGDLVRMPCHGAAADLRRPWGAIPVSGNVPDTEFACRVRWGHAAKMRHITQINRAILHAGTGLLGALDGAVDSPFMWAPDFAWKQISPPILLLSRILWGPVDYEGGQCCKYPHQREWFVDFDISVMPLVELLAGTRRINKQLYENLCIQLVGDALESMGNSGWCADEMRRGTISSPYEAVDIVNTIEMFDSVCMQFERRLTDWRSAPRGPNGPAS